MKYAHMLNPACTVFKNNRTFQNIVYFNTESFVQSRIQISNYQVKKIMLLKYQGKFGQIP